MKEKILFSWSGGKDCTLSLYEVLQSDSYEVVSLFTIVTEDDDRSVMDSVRSKLLDLQSAALNIPMVKIYISRDNDKAYSHKMQEFLKEFQKQGVNTVAFGDIFLEDLKQYRENNLSRIGMKSLFPIWKRDSTALANQFINLQFKAILTSVDLKHWMHPMQEEHTMHNCCQIYLRQSIPAERMESSIPLYMMVPFLIKRYLFLLEMAC